MHCFPSLTQPQLTFYGSKDQAGSFWTVVRAGRTGGSSIRLTHECVTGYFGFLNGAKAECGPGWAFSHVYLCMYEHVCMREEAFQEKPSGRLPLTAIHRQIQNTKQQLLQSEARGVVRLHQHSCCSSHTCCRSTGACEGCGWGQSRGSDHGHD